MINNKFNRKFRKLLSVSYLGVLCCSHIAYALRDNPFCSTSQEFRRELFNNITSENKSRVRRLLRRSRDLLTYNGNFSPKDIGEPLGKGSEKRDYAKYTHIPATEGYSVGVNECYYGIVYQDETLSYPIKFILLKVDDKVIILPYNKTTSDALYDFFKKRNDRIFAMKVRNADEKLTIEEVNKRYKKDIEKLKMPNDIEEIAWNKGSKYFAKYLMQVLDPTISNIIKYGVPLTLTSAVIAVVAYSKFQTYKS